MSRVFDERGRYLGDASSVDPSAVDPTADQPAPDASAGSSSFVESFGAALFELTHPFTVQAEYEAVGKTPPPVTEIMSQAVSDMETQASAGLTAGVTQLESTVKLVAVAAVILGGIYVYKQLVK